MISERSLRKEIKREYPAYAVFIFLFYVILFVWKNNLVSRFFNSRVDGLVIDVSENSPIELIPLAAGDNLTYTDYQGKFSLTGLFRDKPKINVMTPGNYEKGSEKEICTNRLSGFFDKEFSCQYFLYPQPFEVAYRVLNDETAVGLHNISERATRKKSLWVRSYNPSRQAFGREGEFIDLLSLKEEIDVKMGKELVRFRVDEKRVVLDKFTDPLTRREFSEVAEVFVVRLFADGSTVGSKEHFVRENGVWRYLIPYSSQELKRYVAVNGWVLKIKE